MTTNTAVDLTPGDAGDDGESTSTVGGKITHAPPVDPPLPDEIVLMPLDVATLPRDCMRIAFVANLPNSGVTHAACELVASMAAAGVYECVRVLGAKPGDNTPAHFFGASAVTRAPTDADIRACVGDNSPADVIVVDHVSPERRNAAYDVVVSDPARVSIVMTCQRTVPYLPTPIANNLDLEFHRRDCESVRATAANVMRAATARDYRYLVASTYEPGRIRYWHHRAPSRAAVASRLLPRSEFRGEPAATSLSSSSSSSLSSSSSSAIAPLVLRVPLAITLRIAAMSWLPDAVALLSATRGLYATGTAYLAKVAPAHEYRERHPGNVTVVTRCEIPAHLRAAKGLSLRSSSSSSFVSGC